MNACRTRSGGFPIGFRRLGSSWQGDAATLGRWGQENGFAFVDLQKSGAIVDLATLASVEFAVGQVDLLDAAGYDALIAGASVERAAQIAQTSEHIAACAAAGARLFFCVTIPADQAKSRRENFAHLVDSFTALLPALEAAEARVAIEGWPGAGSVCCTPETYRAFFHAIGSDRFGVNYDPSHLLRMGIDPLRFLREFATRVYHVHAKDTALDEEGRYQFGHEIPPALAPLRRWAGGTWRYTIPGDGGTDWTETFRVLEKSGYRGLVSIELEDENYHGTQDGEERGFLAARDFLAKC